LALQIESSVYKKFCATEDVVNADYRNKMRSLSLNLKDKNNPQFRRKVVEGRVDATKLVDLTPAEMASEERLAEIRTLEQQNMLVAQSAAELEAETDAFKCGRCKQRKCRYYQKQTRSADEPM
jgi:transcription elongation factor S-II